MFFFVCSFFFFFFLFLFFFQAEDGIRDLVRSRGLGDVYKRQVEFTTQIDLVKIFTVLIHVHFEGDGPWLWSTTSFGHNIIKV